MVSISDARGRNRREFEQTILRVQANPTLEKFIFCIFEHLIAGSNPLLEKTGNEILALEQKILEHQTTRSMDHVIFNLKKSMTICRNYYETLSDFVEAVQDNENDILPGENFRYLKIINTRIDRLGAKTQMLYDNLVHLREIYQSSLDYDLNNIMKLFTVVTTVFLPLTLIVGWYGMNFTNMPEFHWKYGYLCVIIISIAIVLFCFWFFKKKKLL